MDKKIVMNWSVAVAVAVIYLAVSIVFQAWSCSWIIWVIYALYRFIVK